MNITLVFSLALLVSCTHRRSGDREIEKTTGERNMTSVMNCWDVPQCFQKSVDAAKAECASEKKEYVFIRNLDQLVTYKCK